MKYYMNSPEVLTSDWIQLWSDKDVTQTVAIFKNLHTKEIEGTVIYTYAYFILTGKAS